MNEQVNHVAETEVPKAVEQHTGEAVKVKEGQVTEGSENEAKLS